VRGGHRPDKILSEGEQRAVALADFLTEVGLNPSSAGIVLDDPVTSQDHYRKDRIARRLVAEAKTGRLWFSRMIWCF
jgi:wobble nucleotide-excising tRNase